MCVCEILLYICNYLRITLFICNIADENLDFKI